MSPADKIPPDETPSNEPHDNQGDDASNPNESLDSADRPELAETFTGDADDDPSSDATRLDETVNSDQTVLELEKTVEMDATVQEGRVANTVSESSMDSTYDPDDQPTVPDMVSVTRGTVLDDSKLSPSSSAKTVADVDPLDATVDVEAFEKAPTVVMRSHSSTAQSPETVPDSDLAGVESGHANETLQAGNESGTSLLEDTNLGQTINPRDLTNAEASYWADLSAEFTNSKSPTHLPPAINRSISETRLQLRDRQVVTPMQRDVKECDYRLVRLLGKGGMGNVFVARQGSLDRLIAVKVIRPMDEAKQEKLRQQGRLEQVEQGRRQQFLSEAVVTGDLDHPNIVPIHDVAVTGENTLFYAMKRVVGTPWSSVIHDKSRDENIEILIKVADAIGFAHTRGVIHRDIKPENVMLGDFGVVMVMDWGIAIAKPEFEKIDSITPAKGLGGTPSFMAPEMAIGPLEAIGPPADIYLLGATLFMIITGKPPHHAANVSQCLRAAASNKIRDFDPKHCGELMDIALKAMSADPEDRYADATEFQDAIRQYRSHAESITLATRAAEDLADAKETRTYSKFARAGFGFEEAINLWSGNEPAIAGFAETRLAHAEAAYENQDYDLGLSLLNPSDPDHKELIDRLGKAQTARQIRESRFGLLKKATAALLAVVLIGGSVAYHRIRASRNDAEESAKKATKSAILAHNNYIEAEKQRMRAEQEQQSAIAEREKAEASRKVADEARLAADKSAKEARDNEAKAKYESYVSKLVLAKKRIEENEFDEARRLLGDLEAPFIDAQTGQYKLGRPWELRWLSSLANQSTAEVKTPTTVNDLAFSAVTGQGVAGLDDGTIVRVQVRSDEMISIGKPSQLVDGSKVRAVAMFPDGKRMALATSSNEIQIHPVEFPSKDIPAPLETLAGHRDVIDDVLVIDERTLISASDDRTVRIWDLQSGQQLADLWHIAPVVKVAATKQGSDLFIAAAVADKSRGQIVCWSVNLQEPTEPKRLGTFTQHVSPVTTVAISPDALSIASGDTVGNVFVWQPSSLPKVDLTQLINRAVKGAKSETKTDKVGRNQPTDYQSLRPLATHTSATANAGDSETGSNELRTAHAGQIRDIQFSSDSRSLLTCGDDYLTHIWAMPKTEKSSSNATDKSQVTWLRTLRGHGGPVLASRFVGSSSDRVVSAGKDSTIRLWDFATDSAESSIQRNSRTVSESQDTPSTPSNRDEVVAHEDEIWSARLSPNANFVVTASRDRTAKVLRIDSATRQFASQKPLQFSIADTPGEDSSSPVANALREGSRFRAMSMVVDNANRRLFVGAADSVVRMWNLDRGTEIAAFSQTGLNNMLAVSDDGTIMVTDSSSEDARALIWRLDSKGRADKIDLDPSKLHQESVAAVAISPDGETIFTGDRAGRGILWHTDDATPIGKPMDQLLGTRINDAAFARDGKSVWIAADDSRLSQLDVSTGKFTKRLDHDGFVTRLALSDDGKQALTIDELVKINGTVFRATLWDLANGKHKTLAKLETKFKARSVAGGRPAISSIALDDTSAMAVVTITPPGESANRVEIWDTSGGVESATKRSAFALPIRIGDVAACKLLGKSKLVTLHGNAAFLWDIKTRKHERSFRSHGALTQAVFSPDERFVVTASRSVKVWDYETGSAIGKLETPHEGAVRAVACSPNRSEAIIATGGDDGAIRHWKFDEATGKFSKHGKSFVNFDEGSPLSLQYSPDGKWLVSTTTLGRVRLHELASGHTQYLLADSVVGAINACRFSGDGKWVVAGGDDKLARLWNVESIIGVNAGKDIVDGGEAIHQTSTVPMTVFRGHAEPIESVSIEGTNSSSLRVFTGSRDQSVRVWDPRIPHLNDLKDESADDESTIEREGRELLELRGHSGGVVAVDLSLDGGLLMTAARDGKVKLWPAGD